MWAREPRARIGRPAWYEPRSEALLPSAAPPSPPAPAPSTLTQHVQTLDRQGVVGGGRGAGWRVRRAGRSASARMTKRKSETLGLRVPCFVGAAFPAPGTPPPPPARSNSAQCVGRESTASPSAPSARHTGVVCRPSPPVGGRTRFSRRARERLLCFSRGFSRAGRGAHAHLSMLCTAGVCGVVSSSSLRLWGGPPMFARARGGASFFSFVSEGRGRGHAHACRLVARFPQGLQSKKRGRQKER